MQENRWQKIEDIFNRAVHLPLEARQAFVEKECGTNIELCREVLRLLENDTADNSFLNRPVLTLGAKVLDNDFTAFARNEKFAGYKIHHLLGRGGMGAVFLAEDTRLERPVALKILPSFVTTEEQSVQRFRQEARAASNVSHPSVVHIYEFGQYENRYYLAMEYVRGRTLRELIKEKLIDLPRALDIALQVAAALSAAHKNGIIHRDIKPENIMVVEDGAVKVLDFGLAKLNPVLESHEQLASVASLETVPGLLMGTVAYMSPEQLRGHRVDERTDLWSLGVVLYEMLAGTRPFRGDTPSDISAAVLRDDFAALPSARKFDSDLTEIIKKCLQKDRLRRYENAFALVTDLERVRTRLKGEGHNAAKDKDWTLGDWLLKAVLPFILASVLATIAFTGNPSLLVTAPTENKPAQSTELKPPNTSDIQSIAVLPLQITNERDKTSAEYQRLNFLCLGLAEDLTRGLGSGSANASNAFKVISFSSAKQMSGISDAGELQNRLGADAVLRGNISRNGELLNVTIELLKINDDSVLWRKEFDADWQDSLKFSLKLRNTLATLIINELQTQNNGRLVLSDYQIRNEEAFRAYIAGKYAPDDQSTADERHRAVLLLKQAIKIDPDYALAHVALADVYNLLGSWHGEKPEYYLPLAERTLERASQLAPDLSEAHTSLAKIKMDARKYPEAEALFLKAIELNPNNALAHHWYGEVYLSAMGRFQESLRELETAHRLDPLSSRILTAMAWTRVGMKDYHGAIADCDRAIKLNLKYAAAYSIKAMALMKLNRFEEAIAMANEAELIEGGAIELGVIYALAGQSGEAQKYLQKLEREKLKGGNVSNYDIAVIYAALGERDRAFALLMREAKSKSVDLLSIRVDPLLDTLREDSRFNALEAKLNLPERRN